MRVTKETIESLKLQGIIIKNYPTTYDEFYKKCWGKCYKDSIRSYFSQNDWTHEWTTDEIEKLATDSANNDVDFYVNNWYESTLLFIEYEGRLIVRKETIKNKEITIDYILKWIEKDKKMYRGKYGKFTLALQKLVSTQLKDFLIYPTTYGIGVWVFYNFNFDKDKNAITELLDKCGIEYYNEYSQAKYVYRYKISKAKENINKLRKIK